MSEEEESLVLAMENPRRRFRRKGRKVRKPVNLVTRRPRRRVRKIAYRTKATRRRKVRRKASKEKPVVLSPKTVRSLARGIMKGRTFKAKIVGNALVNNPRRRRKRIKVRRLVSNPFGEGGGFMDLLMLKGISYEGKWLEGIGFGILGLVDSNLIGWAVSSAVKDRNYRVLVRLGTQFGAGTLLSYLLGKKDPNWGKYHQVGVYVGLLFGIIGEMASFAATSSLRGAKLKGISGEVKGALDLLEWGDIRDVATAAIGLKPILNALKLNKIMRALRGNEPMKLLGNVETGQLSIAKLDGEVLLKGSSEQIGRIVKAITDTPPALGEDITIEK